MPDNLRAAHDRNDEVLNASISADVQERHGAPGKTIRALHEDD